MGDGWVLIASVVGVLIASVVGPVVLSLLTNRQRRTERAEDWARQDAVAAQAAEAATLLLAANERVDRSTKAVRAQLQQIHVLVNSNLTAAIQAELTATEFLATALRENISKDEAAGVEPSAEALGNVRAVDERVAELRAQIDDRHRSTVAGERELAEGDPA